MPVAQILDKLLVAVNVVAKLPELAGQHARGFGITRVELPHFGIQQIVKEQRPAPGTISGRCTRTKAPASLGFLAGDKGPADGLGVGEDARLDSFLFGGGGHFFKDHL